MAIRNDNEGIKITLDDLDQVTLPQPAPAIAPQPGEPGAKSYGNISNAEPLSPFAEERGSMMLQGWFYLGVAGLMGAIVGWGICEPRFVDNPTMHRWGNTWMLPSIVAMMCIGFGLAESIVERSVKKALIRTAISFPLGILFGFIFDLFANIVFNVALGFAAAVGAHDFHNPVTWLARGIGWMVFGVGGGLVYGIIGQSMKKAHYGIIGGLIGAGIGGLIFDPIGFSLSTGTLSRLVGFALFGLSTGASVGIVESALKDRWLYVSSGPLAGKQFILYKQVTTLGSNQQCDIYLFKDSNILPEHAVLETRGSKVQLRAGGQVYVSGQPVSTRVLQDGDMLQIGRYGFRYKEKQKS
jgi:hypothetical protein